jgi:aryl-alcohol dehydrogenase-like predicted oxidoreductase
MKPRKAVESITIEGIGVSPIGLGTSRLASLGARNSTRQVSRLLDVTFDLGVNFIDTADTYGSTACERRLGETMHRRPHRFVVASKCGLPTADLPGPLGGFNQPAKKILQRLGQDHYLGPGYVRRSIDASLRRLRRERIEFYFLHSPPLGVEKMDDLFEVLDDARARGKIGTFGISSADLRVIDAVTKVHKCRIAQTAVNPRTTEALRTFLNSMREAEAPVLVANGVLTGTSRQGIKPRDQALNTGSLTSQHRTKGANQKFTKAQLLIRHAAALNQVKVVLVGTSDPAHLAEDVAALATPARYEDLLACLSTRTPWNLARASEQTSVLLVQAPPELR